MLRRQLVMVHSRGAVEIWVKSGGNNRPENQQHQLNLAAEAAAMDDTAAPVEETMGDTRKMRKMQDA
jgi:hypothetical protein